MLQEQDGCQVAVLQHGLQVGANRLADFHIGGVRLGGGLLDLLDEQVQGLKDEVLDLNRELFLLEEELLFPANTQVAVFLSMDVGEYFAIDSVQFIDVTEEAGLIDQPVREGPATPARATAECRAADSSLPRR